MQDTKVSWRKEVSIVNITADYAVQIRDHLFERDVQLPPPAGKFVHWINGELTIQQAVDQAVDQGLSRISAEQLARMCVLLLLVEGAGKDIIERFRQVRSGKTILGLRTLPEARFQCQGSGACCQNYVFGPLPDSDVEKLEELNLVEDFPHLAVDGVIDITPIPGSGRIGAFSKNRQWAMCISYSRQQVWFTTEIRNSSKTHTL